MKTTRGARTAAVTHRLAATAVYALVVAQGGCASSQPSRFYQLHAASHPDPQVEVSSSPGSLIVGIGPIRVPDYLDRPQIVTLSGNEIDVADFDRWAGSMQDDIAAVLVEDISARLPVERFFVTRWPSPHESLSYRIEVSIERFEGPMQGPVSLKAQWYAFAPNGRVLLNRSSSISERVTAGGGYGALVEAMSRALDGLSRVIAEGVTSLSQVPAAER